MLTLHRPSNVDDPAILRRILEALHEISARLPIVFSCHPRTAEQMKRLDGYEALAATGDLRVLPPLGYLEFLRLYSQSRIVFTDSGGLQEETTYLGIPCLTLRENTERPVTVTEGTNVLCGNDPQRILRAADEALGASDTKRRVPELWDGSTAPRIVDVFESWWKRR